MSNKCETSKMVNTIPTISQQCNSSCSPCGGLDTITYNQTACPASMPLPSASCSTGCSAPELYAQTDSDFTFPDQGFGATVAISNVKLAVGQAITAERYGTLYVEAILDSCAGYYEVKNIDISDPMLIGRPVPAGTVFFLGAPATIATFGSSGGCNPLVADFIVPTVGTTAPAKVTSLAGLSINDEIILRSKANPSLAYTYKLTGISGVDTLILKNEGEGGTPFSIIDAGDNEVWEWCVESTSSLSLCEQAVSTTTIKSLIGCDVDGNTKKITSTSDNQALVYSTALGGYVNKTIPEAVTCVTLETCFQLSPGAHCVAPATFITTSNDTQLLGEAAAAVLSENANPIITICDKEFYIDLDASSVGNIKVIPNHEVTVLEQYDTTCQVCIPADCCTQCDPQIIYPDPLYFPPGKNEAMNVAIPTALFTATGEYKLSLVKSADLLSNIILVHNPANNSIIAAYNSLGASIAIPSGADLLAYKQNLIYEHKDACPVDAQYDRDVTLQISNIPSGMRILYNHNTQVAIYPCATPGVGGTEISSTQMHNTHMFVGPAVQSAVSAGSDPWSISLGSGIAHTYDPYAGYNRRTVVLFDKQTLIAKTMAYLLVNITVVPTPGDFVYVAMGTTDMFKLARI